jgi:hypothetical protein
MMKDICITRNAAYACWLLSDFSDQCINRSLDDETNFFIWSHQIFIKWFSITGGLIQATTALYRTESEVDTFHAMTVYEVVEVDLYSFLTPAIDFAENSTQHRYNFTTGAHYTGSWVGSSVGLPMQDRKNNLFLLPRIKPKSLSCSTCCLPPRYSYCQCRLPYVYKT